MTELQIISSDNLERTIEVLIDGCRYEYWFHGEVPLPTIRKIMRHSTRRAIQYLKRNSYKVVKHGANASANAKGETQTSDARRVLGKGS